MNITDKAVLVTGANRGIGQGARRGSPTARRASGVYAGTRQPLGPPQIGRVTPLTLDVTNAAQIQAAVEAVESLDILINNAGVGLYDDLSDRGVLEQHLAVNLFGSYGVTQAFLPLLTRSRGAIVNVAVAGGRWPPLPLDPAYSISKAAAFSLTQSLRALLGRTGRDGCMPSDRPRRHRHDPKLRHPQGLSGIRRASHPRRRGERGGGHLPRSHVGVHGGGLAQRCVKAFERQFAALVYATPIAS